MSETAPPSPLRVVPPPATPVVQGPVKIRFSTVVITEFSLDRPDGTGRSKTQAAQINVFEDGQVRINLTDSKLSLEEMDMVLGGLKVVVEKNLRIHREQVTAESG